MNHKEMNTFVLAIIFMTPTIFLAVPLTVNAQEELPDEITIQQTKTSVPGAGDEGQLVMALLPRDDGMIWDGVVTWVASKPVEVVILQGYNSSAVSNQTSTGSNQTSAEFGEPLNGLNFAITLVKPDSGTPVPSGSMPFVGNALNFVTGGEKFTVTYSIHATANEFTEGPGAEEGDED